jgi:hypothetical protein
MTVALDPPAEWVKVTATFLGQFLNSLRETNRAGGQPLVPSRVAANHHWDLLLPLLELEQHLRTGGSGSSGWASLTSMNVGSIVFELRKLVKEVFANWGIEALVGETRIVSVGVGGWEPTKPKKGERGWQPESDGVVFIKKPADWPPGVSAEVYESLEHYCRSLGRAAKEAEAAQGPLVPKSAERSTERNGQAGKKPGPQPNTTRNRVKTRVLELKPLNTWPAIIEIINKEFPRPSDPWRLGQLRNMIDPRRQ